MYGSNLKAKVIESVNELEKIASIKFGQKWSVTNMTTVGVTTYERAVRTVWYTSDGRSKTKAYFISVYDNAFSLLESIFVNVSNYILPNAFAASKQFKLIKKLMINIPAANTGLTNIKGSYNDDREFGKWIDQFLKSVNKKVNDAHSRLQNYLITAGLLDPKIRENKKLMKADSTSISPYRLASTPIRIQSAIPPGSSDDEESSGSPPPDALPEIPQRAISLRKSQSQSEPAPIYMHNMEFEGAPSDSDSGEDVNQFMSNLDQKINSPDIF